MRAAPLGRFAVHSPNKDRQGSPNLGRASRKPYNASVSDHFCYILQCSDESFYTGWTTDPIRRLREHNAGRGARYTRSRRPLRMVFLERQPDRAAAMRREAALKHLSRARKQALIDANTPETQRYQVDEEDHAR